MNEKNAIIWQNQLAVFTEEPIYKLLNIYSAKKKECIKSQL